MMDRRQFLAGSAAALAAVAGSACGGGDESNSETVYSPLPANLAADDEGWEEVRRQFLIPDDVIEMSALLISSHPRSVRDAIEAHRRELDRRPTEYLNEVRSENDESVLSTAANYLGADRSQIALTDSTTGGLGLVYNGINIELGQEFLTTTQNYYSTDEAIRLRAERTGASVRRVPLYENAAEASAEELAANVVGAIGSATRVVALTWVHSSTGLKLPISAIAQGISEINAEREEGQEILLAVDGVHGFGVENVKMQDLGCDYFIAGCHKWLFGPRGTGIVWASERGWQNITPTIPTFMDGSVREAWVLEEDPSGRTTGRRFSPGGFKAFEHQWAMTEAFEMHLELGKSSVQARTYELAGRLKRGLAEMDHITLHTPVEAALSSGIVCFEVEGMSASRVVDRLAEKRIVATVTPYATLYARLTPSIRNTPREIDAVLDAVSELG
jgi:isopenicillin-N epimerase